MYYVVCTLSVVRSSSLMRAALPQLTSRIFPVQSGRSRLHAVALKSPELCRKLTSSKIMGTIPTEIVLCMYVKYLVSWNLVYVSLLFHQNDSLHGLVRVGVVLGELTEARLAPERIRHCGERRRGVF